MCPDLWSGSLWCTCKYIPRLNSGWTYPCAQSHVEEPLWGLKAVELEYEQGDIDTHPCSLGEEQNNRRIRPLPLRGVRRQIGTITCTLPLTKTIHFGSSLIAQPERFTILLLCCNNPAKAKPSTKGSTRPVCTNLDTNFVFPEDGNIHRKPQRLKI